MKPFEIFRSGTHTTAKGQTVTFAESDIADIAASYDPALHHAPIVIGHPKQDGPAYGWIKSLSVRDGTIVAEPEELDTTFSEMVRESRFKKVSAGLYAPNDKSNPTPGKYHLRHVGFLGAEPPAIKGLKPIEFAEGELDIELNFSEWRMSWALDNVGRIFRAIREFIIDTKDIETADKIIPSWDLDQIDQQAADLRADARVEEATHTHFSESQPEEPDMKTAEQRQAELDARETALAQRETTFSEEQKKQRDTADAAFVASVVEAGRLPVGLKEAATALFSELEDGDTLTFSEGDQQVTKSSRAAFRDLLEKLPVPVATGELATGDGPDFSDSSYVQTAIETEIRNAAAKGEKISPATAAMRLKATQR
ncbi:peptidase [Brucella anthropi]|uniref:peptidase n=1 Tax=Brucella anthropi TaxID=529 RepID=UPI00045229E6|nr:peptidase [Brucella anthropi]EXL08214.1 peptidase [Brucella anthropi]